MGNKTKAKDSFTSSAGQSSRAASYLTFYQGLSNLKNGNKAKATEIFNSLVSDGDSRIKQKPEVDFFSKFGGKEAENIRLSQAYLLKGLGYKGMGDKTQAKENLQKAVELSSANLWAKAELQN